MTAKKSRKKAAAASNKPAGKKAAAKATMRDNILSAFGAEPRLVADIAKRVGCDQRAVRAAIDAARGKGWKIERTAPGTFKIEARAD